MLDKIRVKEACSLESGLINRTGELLVKYAVLH